MNSVIQSLIKTANTFDLESQFEKANHVDHILKQCHDDSFVILFDENMIPKNEIDLMEYMDQDIKLYANSIYEEDSFPEEPGFAGLIINGKEDSDYLISLNNSDIVGIISDSHSKFSRKMRRIARKLDVPFVEFNTIPPEDLVVPRHLIDEIRVLAQEKPEQKEIEVEIPIEERNILKSFLEKIKSVMQKS